MINSKMAVNFQKRHGPPELLLIDHIFLSITQDSFDQPGLTDQFL